MDTQTGPGRPADPDDADGPGALARAVRRQLGLGRLLPLGDAADRAWITEAAAAGVLRRAADGLPGVRLGRLRIAGSPAPHAPSDVPLPPGALPPGPLRCAADLAVAAADGTSLPAAAERLRTALWAVSDERLGLALEGIDVRVTDVLTEVSGAPPAAPEPADGTATATGAGTAVLAVPGVAREAPVLGGRDADVGRWVQIAVAGGHRAVDVARAVRELVAPGVAVLVTAVDPGPAGR